MVAINTYLYPVNVTTYKFAKPEPTFATVLTLIRQVMFGELMTATVAAL